jgi:hypothetical protein
MLNAVLAWPGAAEAAAVDDEVATAVDDVAAAVLTALEV